MIIEAILPFLETHGIMISFLGGFVSGESIIMTLAFLSANGLIPLWYVLVFCTLGMYLSDFIPFLFGRLKFVKNLMEKERFARRIEKVEDILLKFTKNNLFLTLLYTKVIYGASIPALIYLGSKKTSKSKFAVNNLLVELIFVPAVVSVGWLSGKGFSSAITILKDIKIGIFLLVVLIIVLYSLRKWVNNKLIRIKK